MNTDKTTSPTSHRRRHTVAAPGAAILKYRNASTPLLGLEGRNRTDPVNQSEVAKPNRTILQLPVDFNSRPHADAVIESDALERYRKSGQHFGDDPKISELLMQHFLKTEISFPINLILNKWFLTKIQECLTNCTEDIDFQTKFSDLPQKHRQFLLLYLHAKKKFHASSRATRTFVKTYEFYLDIFLARCKESPFVFNSSQGTNTNLIYIQYNLKGNDSFFEVRKNEPSSVYFFIKLFTRYLTSDQSTSFIYNPENLDAISTIIDYLKTYKSYDSVFDLSVSNLIFNFFYKLCLNVDIDSAWLSYTLSILTKFIENGLLIEGKENEKKQFFEIKQSLAGKILKLFNHENKNVKHMGNSFLMKLVAQKEFIDQDLIDNFLDKLCFNVHPPMRLSDTLLMFTEFIENDLFNKDEVKQCLMEKIIKFFYHKNIKEQLLSIGFLLYLAKKKEFINRNHVANLNLIKTLVNFFESDNSFASEKLQSIVLQIIGLLRAKGLVSKEEEKEYKLTEMVQIICKINVQGLKKFSWAEDD